MSAPLRRSRRAERLVTRDSRLERQSGTFVRFHAFPSRQSRIPSRALPAFSLVELIVGAIIAALVAGATASSLSMLLKSRTTSANRQQAFARADAAASRIASDAATLIRDPVLSMARVRVQDQGGDANPHDDLLMLVRSVRPIRSTEEGAEGGEYEVQYRVEANSAGPRNESLWRRIDHAFDDNQEGGGIASAIVPHVSSLSVEAYDGESWYPSWDSDSDGYPHALRVIVRATSDDASVFATARRVIAIDRTPLPPPEEDDSNTDTKNQPSTASTTPTTSNAGGTTPRATPTAPNPRGGRNPGGGNRNPGAGNNNGGGNRNPGTGPNPGRGGGGNNPGNRGGGGNQGPRPGGGGVPRGGGG